LSEYIVRPALQKGLVMTLSARFSLLDSDLNDFLFAPVGEESNGMSLSVISALTRLDLDPWDEAARLATLPRALAAETLAPMIARLAIGCSPRLDDAAVAHRLIELLPLPGRTAAPGREPASVGPKKYLHAIMLLICLALTAAIFIGRL
jgi:hypothetical protein